MSFDILQSIGSFLKTYVVNNIASVPEALKSAYDSIDIEKVMSQVISGFNIPVLTDITDWIDTWVTANVTTPIMEGITITTGLVQQAFNTIKLEILEAVHNTLNTLTARLRG